MLGPMATTKHRSASLLAWALACIGGVCASGCSNANSTSPNDGGLPDATGAQDGSITDDSGSARDSTTPDAPEADSIRPESGAPPDAFACTVAEPPDSGGGVLGCDAGALDGGGSDCAFSVCLTGGLQERFSSVVPSCGGLGNDLLLDWSSTDPQSGVHTTIEITFPTSIPVDYVGSVAISNVEVFENVGQDGGGFTWKTPPGSCTFTITSSTCAPTSVFTHQRILTGTGNCTQAAAPQAGTNAAPVNIGSFTFEGFINPP
jgi:hypothetical protein